MPRPLSAPPRRPATSPPATSPGRRVAIRFAIGAALVAIAIFLPLRGRFGRTEIANLLTADGPGGIVVLGDSLAAGTGAGPGESWPERVGEALGCNVVNAGVPGNTTADGLARLGPLLDAKPRIVVVELGGNDFLRKLDRAQTERNLDSILEKVVAAGAIPVVTGLELGAFVDEYGPVYARVARRRGAVLVPDLLGGVLGSPSLMADPIHPNAAGYRVVASKVETALREILDRSGRPCTP